MMRNSVKLISFLGLGTTLLAAILFWAGMFDLPTAKIAMLAGTIVWFATCPLWMGRELPVDSDQVEI
ncbi:MAG: hypothetical protein ACE37I_06915 [Rubinisphaera brasiliensis]|nr:hypothetical protein [Rubinisphaera brasiliensis]